MKCLCCGFEGEKVKCFVYSDGITTNHKTIAFGNIVEEYFGCQRICTIVQAVR